VRLTEDKLNVTRLSIRKPTRYTIHWRGAGTVLVASLRCHLFFQHDAKIQHRHPCYYPFYTTVRLTVMAGADLLRAATADRDLYRGTSLNDLR
jgi:hypothetical protein